MLFQRLIAAMLLIIAGAVSMFGVKFMRDAVFFALTPDPEPYILLRFIGGLLLFIAGLAFIGGYVFTRERKKGRLSKKLMRQRKENVEVWLKKQNKN